jgi:quinol monooxygenase YgiN
MRRIAVACYRPKPGREKELLEVVKEHIPTLNAEGFVTDRPPVVMRAADGTIVEILEWASKEAKEQAHGHPAVRNLWDRLAECAEFPTLSELEEGSRRFCNFDPVDP